MTTCASSRAAFDSPLCLSALVMQGFVVSRVRTALCLLFPAALGAIAAPIATMATLVVLIVLIGNCNEAEGRHCVEAPFDALYLFFMISWIPGGLVGLLIGLRRVRAHNARRPS